MANEYIKKTQILHAIQIYFVRNKVLEEQNKNQTHKTKQIKIQKSSLITSPKYTTNIRIFSRMFKCAVLKIKPTSLNYPKGGFFSESAIRFFKSPNLKRKYSKTILRLIFEFLVYYFWQEI